MPVQPPDGPLERQPGQRVVAVVVLVTTAALFAVAYYFSHFQRDARSGALTLAALILVLAFAQAWRWLFVSTNLRSFLDAAFMFLLAPAVYALLWLEVDGDAPFKYAAIHLALPITASVLLAATAFRTQLFLPPGQLGGSTARHSSLPLSSHSSQARMSPSPTRSYNPRLRSSFRAHSSERSPGRSSPSSSRRTRVVTTRTK